MITYHWENSFPSGTSLAQFLEIHQAFILYQKIKDFTKLR
jgi:hypothetical protein